VPGGGLGHTARAAGARAEPDLAAVFRPDRPLALDAAVRPPGARHAGLAVLVAALGYFVDIYDLILFSIVRVPSLVSLGVSETALLPTGVLLLNMQMAGMLVGGLLWGVLGDKRGRLSVLFGSIALYSLANIANALVDAIGTYAVWRFVAGVGLAGELGAGVTLVSELMSRETRGYGAMIISAVGILGAVVASLVGDLFDWRVAYVVGGAMGLVLLVLRVGVAESGMFEQVRRQAVARGDLRLLFRSRERAWRYVSVILVAVPIWYVVGVLVTFSPEFGRAMNMQPLPSASRAVMFCYIGLSLGSLASGTLSQMWRTRNKVVAVFLALTAAGIAAYFLVGHRSLTVFYTVCALLGVAGGYWAVFVTMASEQFGTNIRATAATTAPNFVRGSVVPVTSAFQVGMAYLGIVGSAVVVGALTVAVAALALRGLAETYGKDLDYVEL
jgi:putative MFS transporter